MCLPGSDSSSGGGASSFIGMLGLGTKLLGGAMSASATGQKSRADRAALEYQASVDEYKAKLADFGASDALYRGEQNTFTSRLREGAAEGTQRAAFASRGVSLDEGSPLNVLADTRFMGNLDAATIGDNAAKEAWALRVTGDTMRKNAAFLRSAAGAINPRMSETGSLLNSAGSVADSWYKLFPNSGGTGSAPTINDNYVGDFETAFDSPTSLASDGSAVTGGTGDGAFSAFGAGGGEGGGIGALGPASLFAALAIGDWKSAGDGKDWTRTVWGGAPPMAAKINSKLGLDLLTDPLGKLFGFG